MKWQEKFCHFYFLYICSLLKFKIMRKVIIMLLCLFTMYSFKNDVITGKASYYGKNHHGRKTASGEIFNMYKYTAAHKYLKFGTMIKVTSLETDKSVIVRINDRGPFIKGRDLDLSKSAFFEIAPKKYGGSINVKIEIIKKE